MTVTDVVESYINDRSGVLRPRTIEQYRDLLDRYITPFIGDMPADQFTGEDARLLIDLVGAQHGRTAELLYILLRASLGDALRGIRKPRYTHRQMEIWTDDQMQVYQTALRDHPHGVALALGIYMGLRRGEICGLRWGDLNFNTGRCFIHNQRMRLASGAIVDGPPKSATSCRVIPIPSGIVDWLRGAAGADTEYVDAITPSGLYHAHRRLCARLGLPPLSLHGLRHCMATRCLRAGGDARALQSLLGHSTVAVTLDIYTHPDMHMLSTCINLGVVGT